MVWETFTPQMIDASLQTQTISFDSGGYDGYSITGEDGAISAGGYSGNCIAAQRTPNGYFTFGQFNVVSDNLKNIALASFSADWRVQLQGSINPPSPDSAQINVRQI